MADNTREILINVNIMPVTDQADNNYEQLTDIQHQEIYQPNTEANWMKDAEDDKKNPEEETSLTKSSFLDPSFWKRVVLNEKAARDKFKKRATDPKYVNARFKCTDCFTNFAREEKLQKHILINHSKSAGEHVCRFCRRRFQKPCKLRMHMKKHYNQIECLRCNMTFCGEGLAFQHEEFHRGVIITCKYCTQQFRHKSTYYQHVRNQHRSSHVCALCGASFISRAGLNVHKRRLHTDDTVCSEEQLQQNQEAIHCKKCDIKFVSMAAYHEHYKHSTLHADGVDNSYVINVTPDIMQVVDTSDPSMFVRCSVCCEVFATPELYLRHHRAAHPAAPFMRKCAPRPHTAHERVNCDVCGVRIKATSLYTHMNAHTRTRVYKCPLCPMEFPYPTSLLRHKVTHTGEKKYPCALCDKRFTQRNSMKLHYRTFHLKEPYPKRNRKKKTQEPQQEQMNLPLML